MPAMKKSPISSAPERDASDRADGHKQSMDHAAERRPRMVNRSAEGCLWASGRFVGSITKAGDCDAATPDGAIPGGHPQAPEGSTARTAVSRPNGASSNAVMRR